VFGLSDFDETWPGPFEWEVKRLTASVELAARANGYPAAPARSIVVDVVRAYREAMRKHAGRGNLEVWYAHVSAEVSVPRLFDVLDKGSRKAFTRTIDKARSRDSLGSRRKLTEVVDGRLRLVSRPPLVIPSRDLDFGPWSGAAREMDHGAYRGVCVDPLDEPVAAAGPVPVRRPRAGRWSALAASAPGPGWSSSSAATTTTRCSCSRKKRSARAAYLGGRGRLRPRGRGLRRRLCRQGRGRLCGLATGCRRRLDRRGVRGLTRRANIVRMGRRRHRRIRAAGSARTEPGRTTSWAAIIVRASDVCE
jgi:Uncharacterized protein conserved in bacteria (DUF2252)